MSDESPQPTRRIATAFGHAAITAGFVMATIIGVAYFGGYPGFGDWWLLNVVIPAYITETALVGLYWSRRELPALWGGVRA